VAALSISMRCTSSAESYVGLESSTYCRLLVRTRPGPLLLRLCAAARSSRRKRRCTFASASAGTRAPAMSAISGICTVRWYGFSRCSASFSSKICRYSSADIAEATSFELATQTETPLQELEARELGSEIERAISRLRPEYRSCILLRHVEDKSYEEIAATLDLPLGTVKTYIHRARHELRKLLEHVREGGPGPPAEEPA